MREIAVKTTKLTKKYKDFAALNEADMTIYRGDIYGIIGRNGAGKTTLMKTLTGLTNKTSGEFEIFSKSGAEAEKERKRIGCLIEAPAFFSNMSARDNLKYYCIQKGITDYSKIDEVLKLVQLADTGKKKFKSFSLGMKQRLGIAFSILDNPDLIILDEPINGLDPIGISDLRKTFFMLNEERALTIVISSHILSELYAVANRFLFIDKGRVVKEISKEELDLECQKCLVIKVDDSKKAIQVLENKLNITNYKVIDEGEVRIYDENVSSGNVNMALASEGVMVSEFYNSGISLEDYFKSLVGEA